MDGRLQQLSRKLGQGEPMTQQDVFLLLDSIADHRREVADALQKLEIQLTKACQAVREAVAVILDPAGGGSAR